MRRCDKSLANGKSAIAQTGFFGARQLSTSNWTGTVELHEIATRLIQDTQASAWPAFAPEIVLCVTIMAMLLVRVVRGGQRVPGFLMAMIGSGVALYFAAPWVHLAMEEGIPRRELFTGMLVFDGLTVFVRSFLLVFAILFAIFTRLSKNPEKEDSVDFYCLVLGATLGMCLMASANHLLMVFLAVEMASVPSYALAGQLKTSRKSSEAALKYSIYGAGAAGIMLYGISLLAGILNTVHLPTMASQLNLLMPILPAEQLTVLALGGLMLMVGLAFKLSAVPFHFWCPDVFEGASAEVNAFLSVASKAGALALLVRVSLGLGVVPATFETETGVAQVSAAEVSGVPALLTTAPASVSDESVPAVGEGFETSLVADGLHAVADEAMAESSEGTSVYGTDPLAPVRQFIALVVGVVAVVTCTFGNLAAFGQSNIKRLMAYSTIAHAGYMMLAIPPAVAVAATHPEIAESAIAALALYVAIYLLMNLAAFAMIAFYRNSLGSEEIADYAGLVKRSPLTVIMFALVLFSLVGLPPLAGFLGKFAIFAALTNAWQATGNSFLLALLVLGGLNTAISLFYYLRVVKVMTIDPESDASAASNGTVSLLDGMFVALLVIPIVTLLLYTETLNEWTLAATRQLF
jgi:NADH-quinone oxidoreductase subunit N